MDGLVERKKKEIRARVITVAGELFNQQGFENTTMDQIATKAVVARKTLYNYFPLKEAIADEYVRSISKDTAQETLETLSDLPDTRSRLIAAINNRYDWLELNPELCLIAFSDVIGGKLKSKRIQRKNCPDYWQGSVRNLAHTGGLKEWRYSTIQARLMTAP